MILLPPNHTTYGDKLVSFDGETIAYDEYGRTSVYRGKNIYYAGYNAHNISDFGNASFTYYEDGMRRTKTVGGVTHYYTYEGINLIKEEWGNNVLIFLYDASGSPVGMQYRHSSYATDVWDTYYYEKNLQGDVVAVYNTSGTKLVTYTYDAWGRILNTSYHNGGNSTSIVHNNLKYRGYYYDSDLNFYYLATRYYDPFTCRFVTADDPAVLTATPMGLTDKNLYAYCDNNPVMRADNGGEFWVEFGVMAIGGIIGAVINIGVSYGIAKANLEDYDWKNALVDGVSGFISGAVAVTPLNIWGQTAVGAILGAGSSIAMDLLEGKEINTCRASNAVVAGAFSAYLGGNGLGLTDSIATSGLRGFNKVIVKQGIKAFARSCFLSSFGMFAYDYVNERR